MNVTSKGASRSFIVHALFRTLQLVRSRVHYKLSTSFSLSTMEINRVIEMAHLDTQEIPLLELGGSTQYNREDPSSYWSNTNQYTCWIKNNVERKSKFLTILKDSENLDSLNDKIKSRAIFCQFLCSIVGNIKAHFDKNRELGKVTEESMPNPLPRYIRFRDLLPASAFHNEKSSVKAPTEDEPEPVWVYSATTSEPFFPLGSPLTMSASFTEISPADCDTPSGLNTLMGDSGDWANWNSENSKTDLAANFQGLFSPNNTYHKLDSDEDEEIPLIHSSPSNRMIADDRNQMDLIASVTSYFSSGTSYKWSEVSTQEASKPPSIFGFGSSYEFSL